MLVAWRRGIVQCFSIFFCFFLPPFLSVHPNIHSVGPLLSCHVQPLKGGEIEEVEAEIDLTIGVFIVGWVLQGKV